MKNTKHDLISFGFFLGAAVIFALLPRGFVLAQTINQPAFLQNHTNGSFWIKNNYPSPNHLFFDESGDDTDLGAAFMPSVEFEAGASNFLDFATITNVSLLYQNLTGVPITGQTLSLVCDDASGIHNAYSSPGNFDDSGQAEITNFAVTSFPCDATTLNYLFIGITDSSIWSLGGNTFATSFHLIGVNDPAYLDPNVGIDTTLTANSHFLETAQIDDALNGGGLAPIQGPATETSSSNCPAGFSLNFGFGSVDVGKGLCNLFNFILVPNQSALTQFTSTNSVLATKPPFDYFYNISAVLDSVNASSTATMTPLSLVIGSTSTPIHFSVDMFSVATVDRYTNSNSRGLLRTLCEYAIYLGFAAMVIFEVRALFAPKKQG